ncbi:MAG: hypothetical protein PVF26_16755 [Desulfobacterales bacterium]|jgi:hypothetical protein
MKSENINKQVADKITGILQSGLMLNADTLHYIESTFSNPSIGELEELLKDQSSCETDSLIELFFFPDESIQLQLEEILGDTQLQKQDEKDIQEMVCAKPIQTRIRFPDDRGTLLMEATPFNVAQFIAHLNLLRNLNPKLSASIAEHVPLALQTRCRVRLRNTRPIISQNKILFLQAFFEKLQIDSDEYLDYLDLILRFLEERRDGLDMFQALMAKKKFYFLSLQKAKNLDIQLKKHNVETLLLRGKRVPYVDTADARKKIQMIDRISLAVFGKTDFFDLMPAAEQSIRLESKEDIDKLIKELG